MVDVQRLRDWALAGAAVAAVEAGQGPVVVITGTGPCADAIRGCRR